MASSIMTGTGAEESIIISHTAMKTLMSNIQTVNVEQDAPRADIGQPRETNTSPARQSVINKYYKLENADSVPSLKEVDEQ